jgi:hypothetical protein
MVLATRALDGVNVEAANRVYDFSMEFRLIRLAIESEYVFFATV